MIRRSHLLKSAAKHFASCFLVRPSLARCFSSNQQDSVSSIQQELDRLLEGEVESAPKPSDMVDLNRKISKIPASKLKLTRKQAISAKSFNNNVQLTDPPQLQQTLNSLVAPKEKTGNEWVLQQLQSVRTEEAMVQFATSNTDLLDGPTRIALLGRMYEVFKIKKRGGSQATFDDYIASPKVSTIFKAILASFSDLTPGEVAEMFTILSQNQFRNDEYNSRVEKHLLDHSMGNSPIWSDKVHSTFKILFRMAQTGYTLQHFTQDHINELVVRLSKQEGLHPQRLTIGIYYYYKLSSIRKLFENENLFISQFSILQNSENDDSQVSAARLDNSEVNKQKSQPKSNQTTVSFVQALQPHLAILELSQLSLLLSAIPKEGQIKAVEELLILLRERILQRSKLTESAQTTQTGISPHDSNPQPAKEGLSWQEIREVLRAASFSKCQDSILLEEILAQIRRNLTLAELEQSSKAKPSSGAVLTVASTVPASVPARDLLLIQYYLVKIEVD